MPIVIDRFNCYCSILIDRQTLLFQVVDVNDNAPEITIRNITNFIEVDSLNIQQDAPPGTFVANISVCIHKPTGLSS